jgi:hypothetical protein
MRNGYKITEHREYSTGEKDYSGISAVLVFRFVNGVHYVTFTFFICARRIYGHFSTGKAERRREAWDFITLVLRYGRRLFFIFYPGRPFPNN